MILSNSNIKNFIIFSRKKAFLISFPKKACSEKVYYIFRKRNFLTFHFRNGIFRILAYLEL